MTNDLDLSLPLCVPAHLVDRSDPILPDHITQDQVDDAARAYWLCVSTVHWTSLEFDIRKRVIAYIQNEIALAWVLKEAGVA